MAPYNNPGVLAVGMFEAFEGGMLVLSNTLLFSISMCDPKAISSQEPLPKEALLGTYSVVAFECSGFVAIDRNKVDAWDDRFPELRPNR